MAARNEIAGRSTTAARCPCDAAPLAIEARRHQRNALGYDLGAQHRRVDWHWASIFGFVLGPELSLDSDVDNPFRMVIVSALIVGYAYKFRRCLGDEERLRNQTRNPGRAFVTKREAEDALRQEVPDFKARQNGAIRALGNSNVCGILRARDARRCRSEIRPKTIERYGERSACALRQSVEIAGQLKTFGEVAPDKFGTCKWSW